MTLHTCVAEIVDSLPALAADSKENAEQFITNKFKSYLNQTIVPLANAAQAKTCDCAPCNTFREILRLCGQPTINP
jgi:hypothetical protein